jgi:hypothetical protein
MGIGRVWRARWRVVAALVSCCLGLMPALERRAEAAGCAPSSVAVGGQDEAEARFGIRILGVHRSAGGSILDLRYRVLDPARACMVLDRSVRPLLIDEVTGHTLIVPSPPKVGSLRSHGDALAGRTYFILFGNPGHGVDKGSRVSLVIGDLTVSGIAVE